MIIVIRHASCMEQVYNLSLKLSSLGRGVCKVAFMTPSYEKEAELIAVGLQAPRAELVDEIDYDPQLACNETGESVADLRGYFEYGRLLALRQLDTDSELLVLVMGSHQLLSVLQRMAELNWIDPVAWQDCKSCYDAVCQPYCSGFVLDLSSKQVAEFH